MVAVASAAGGEVNERLYPCDACGLKHARGDCGESVDCKHDTRPRRDCLYCLCQAKCGEFQCELDPEHEGDHYYQGGLDAEFAITWPGCSHMFLLDVGGASVRCNNGDPEHEGEHIGVRMLGIDFAVAEPGNPKSRKITQTTAWQEVRWTVVTPVKGADHGV